MQRSGEFNVVQLIHARADPEPGLKPIRCDAAANMPLRRGKPRPERLEAAISMQPSQPGQPAIFMQFLYEIRNPRYTISNYPDPPPIAWRAARRGRVAEGREDIGGETFGTQPETRAGIFLGFRSQNIEKSRLAEQKSLDFPSPRFAFPSPGFGKASLGLGFASNRLHARRPRLTQALTGRFPFHPRPIRHR
jgi:hypothetical protein